MAAGLPFYIFLGLVHSWYLPDKLISTTNNCEKIEDAKNVLDNCLKPIIDPKEFYLLIEGSKENPYRFMQKMCSLKPKAYDCLENATETLESCFNSTMLEGINVWKKVDNDIGDYVCKNDAEVAYNLFEKTGDSCWGIGVYKTLRTCETKLNITAPLYDIHKIKNHCSKYGEFETCMVDSLGKVCPANIIGIWKVLSHVLTTHFCN